MPQVHTTKLKTVPTPTSVEKAARSFLLDREANRCTAATLAWYEQYIGRLVSWLIERDLTELGLVTATHMREYLVDLSKRGLADRTIHHHASAARAFSNFCVDDELLTASPMGKVRMPRLPKEILPAFGRGCAVAADGVRQRAGSGRRIGAVGFGL